MGIGEASGMCPMDPSTSNYRQDCIEAFDQKYGSLQGKSLNELLPPVVSCGSLAGRVTKEAANWLGLPFGIAVAPPEGDQPASLVGSLLSTAGTISCSLGTSVCANLVGEITQKVHISSPAINHFSAANGQPIYMVWLRNGTTFFNKMVHDYAGGDFEAILPHVLQAPAHCQGLLALPFLDDEPGMGVHEGSTAMLLGWGPATSKLSPEEAAGNACKAALVSTLFNLYKGLHFLESQEVPMTEIGLSGGLTKTPECGQIVADVLGLPVRLLEGAEEGCSWGAAVLAHYTWLQASQTSKDTIDEWHDYLSKIRNKTFRSFDPDPKQHQIYNGCYQRYLELLELQPSLRNIVSGGSLPT